MDDDKPFACSISDCGMKFVNEDHLFVHKKKHELSLSLTPSGFKTTFFDQTPTPTRFLNAFESELFQDLQSDNPFDATFRRANSIGENSISIPESSTLISSLPDSEPLSTPSITLTNEADIQIVTSHSRMASLSLKKRMLDKLLIDTPEPFVSHKELSLDGKVVEDMVVSNQEDVRLVVDETSSNLEEPSEILGIQRGLVVQTPVITSVGNLAKSCTTGVPTAVVVTHTSTSDVPSLSKSVSQMSVSTRSLSSTTVAEIAQPVVQSVTVAPVVQLIIRLPDGQSMPVQFPVVSVATTSEVATAPVKCVASISPKTTPTSLAKMKLKQVLTSSQKGISQNGLNLNHKLSVNHVSPSVERRFSPSPQSNIRKPGCNGRKRRDIEDDPDEKRRKSLERNRAAATRCRQKRKHWITTLGGKADELAATNVHLQHEVNMLRNEVAHLKTMLLAHKDCPVTQQQKESGFTQMIFSENARVITYPMRGDCVPIIQSMDTETSSSQSGSVSDTSEVSMKDR